MMVASVMSSSIDRVCIRLKLIWCIPAFVRSRIFLLPIKVMILLLAITGRILLQQQQQQPGFEEDTPWLEMGSGLVDMVEDLD